MHSTIDHITVGTAQQSRNSITYILQVAVNNSSSSEATLSAFSNIEKLGGGG